MSVNDREAQQRPPGVQESLRSLWRDLRGLLHDHLALALLEIQRAAESLISMMVYGQMLALLLAGSWFILLSLLVVWLIDIGLGLVTALLIALAINLLGVTGLLFLIRQKSNDLRLPATMNNLLPERVSEMPVPALPVIDATSDALTVRVSK